MENSVKTLLLVDDEAIIAMAEAKLLEGEGYNVIQALNSEAAIEAVCSSKHEIDLVLMDINLGHGADGTETAREILRFKDIPIVFLSSHTEKEIVEKTEKITSYGYVVKNSGITVLSASIKMAFKLHAANRELKNQEEALRQSEVKFRRIFDQSPVGAAITSPDYFFISVNNELCRMLGYSENELCSLRFSDITHPDHVATDREQVRRLMAGEIDQYSTDKRYIKKDGTVMWGHLSLRSIRDAAGNLLYFLPMVIDVTERKLSEERMRLFNELIDIAPASVTIHDFDGNFSYANQRTFDLHGYSREEFLSLNLRDLDVPESSRLIDHRMKQLREKGEMFFEVGHFKKDGSVLPLGIHAKITEWGGEKVLLSIGMDIRERKSTEEALHISEKRYKRLLDSVSDYFYTVLVADGRPVKTVHGPGCLTVTGYSPEDYEDDPYLWYRMVYDQDREAVASHAEDILAGRANAFLEHRILHRDGSIRWVRNTPVPHHDARGNLLSYDSVIQDITERRQAEQALQKSESLLNSIIDQSPHPMWISDEKGMLIRINRACTEMLNLNPIDVIGKYNVFQDNIVEEQGILPLVEKVFASGEIARFEITYDSSKLKQLKLLGKAFVILETTMFPIMDANGCVTNAVIQHVDITERKHSAEALEKSVKEKEVLLRELQHRIKNNLNVISSLLGLELDKLSDESSRKVFIDAQSRIRSMSAIYEQLYRSTSLDSVQLNSYIKDLADSLFETYTREASNVRITTRLAEIQLEIKRAVPLGLILNELITNALKYAYPGDGKGEISIILTKAGDSVELKVSDKGVGLPKGFDPHTADTMGLRLVGILTEQIDGELTIKSGKGAAISVRFSL